MNLLSLADHIINLNSDGRMAKQGRFEQLSISGQYTDRIASYDKRMSDGDNQEVSDAAIIRVSQPNAETSSADNNKSRQDGDTSIYQFYGASMGWWRLAFLTTTLASYGAFAGLQCKWALHIGLQTLTRNSSRMAQYMVPIKG